MKSFRDMFQAPADRLRLSGVRKTGVVSMLGLSVYLLCGAQSTPQQCNTQNQQIGPSKGEVIGVAVGVIAVIAVGTVVLVEVHKSHHTVKGCVFAGPNGVELRTSGDSPKTYALAGDPTKINVGDLVRLHGDKVKKVKNSKDDQTFMVQKINKDYGPCPVPVAGT